MKNDPVSCSVAKYCTKAKEGDETGESKGWAMAYPVLFMIPDGAMQHIEVSESS
jgi:hypothetical protein